MNLEIFAPKLETFLREKVMNARFASKCSMCRGDIHEGEPIYYSTISGGRHQNCCVQTERTLAQILVDYINSHDRSGNPYAVYNDALNATLVRVRKDLRLVIDRERTQTLPEAWAVLVDGSALRPIDGDPEGRFETFDID